MTYHAVSIPSGRRAAPVMRKALLTIAAGHLHEQMAEITMPSFERYADRHGYELKVCEPLHRMNGEHSKSFRLREALEDYEVALWVDVDAAIASDAPDVAQHLADAHAFQTLTLIGYNPVGLVDDYKGLRETLLLSIGVWAVARHPWAARYFDDLTSQIDACADDPRVADGVTRTAVGVWNLMGFSPGAHQAIVDNGWLPYPLGTVLLNERWNSRGFQDRTGKQVGASISPAHPFIYHATGGPLREDPELRLRCLREFVEHRCS